MELVKFSIKFSIGKTRFQCDFYNYIRTSKFNKNAIKQPGTSRQNDRINNEMTEQQIMYLFHKKQMTDDENDIIKRKEIALIVN